MRFSYIVTFCLLLVASCTVQKQNTLPPVYGKIWEMQYISGIRIAFDGLYPDRKPYIAFDKDAGMVSGNTGCNGYSAPFTLHADSISFGEPGPSTLMYCGEGEKTFLDMMQRVNRYAIDSAGNLELLMNEVMIMRFSPQGNTENQQK
ncbi:MAG: META domain-containing protein [Chitinophagales bacterium]